MVDAIVSPPPATKRKSMLTRMITAKALAAGAVVALTATGAAAATGSLPDDAQHGLAQAAQHVGINLPDTANDHAREHTSNLGPKRKTKTTPTTAGAENASDPRDDAGDDTSSTVAPTAPSTAAAAPDAAGTPAADPPTDNHGGVVSQTAHDADPAGGKGEEVAPVARDNHGAEQRTLHANPRSTTPQSTPHPNDHPEHPAQGNGNG